MEDAISSVLEYAFTNYHPYVVVTVGTFVLHFIFYFGIYIPYYIFERTPSLQKYKVQPDKKNTFELEWRCFKGLLFAQITAELPMMMLAGPVLHYMGARFLPPLPHWQEIGLQIIFFFFVEDCWFYWVHRLLHWGPFYKYIHKIHHEHAAPFGMAAEYAHPAETFILGFGSTLGPYLVGAHLYTMWVWLFFRIWQEVDVHCGYNFPWSLNNFIPFYGGAEYHDFHHMSFVGNYASTFRIWDRLFGTDEKYWAYKQKQKAA